MKKKLVTMCLVALAAMRSTAKAALAIAALGLCFCGGCSTMIGVGEGGAAILRGAANTFDPHATLEVTHHADPQPAVRNGYPKAAQIEFVPQQGYAVDQYGRLVRPPQYAPPPPPIQYRQYELPPVAPYPPQQEAPPVQYSPPPPVVQFDAQASSGPPVMANSGPVDQPINVVVSNKSPENVAVIYDQNNNQKMIKPGEDLVWYIPEGNSLVFWVYMAKPNGKTLYTASPRRIVTGVVRPGLNSIEIGDRGPDGQVIINSTLQK